MPRKQKPPGYEHWTWEEIRLGHRLSKAEKRTRRLARHLGGVEDERGKITPPQGEGQILYYTVFIVLMVVAFGVLLLSAFD